MNKLTKMVKTFSRNVSKHSPAILTGFGIVGMVTAGVMAVRATPKAMKLIEEKNMEKYKENKDNSYAKPNDFELTPVETVKAAWKPYVPAVATALVSTACLIGANSVNSRRTAALATAYKLSETALTEFKEKATEVMGEKKVKEIKESIAKEKIENNPVSNKEVIVTHTGESLCFDAISGRYFKSDIESIRRAVNTLNRRLRIEMFISLTEFYDEIGLSPTKLSDDLGWNIDMGEIEVVFGSQIAEDGRPCIVLDYTIAPRYDYGSLR